MQPNHPALLRALCLAALILFVAHVPLSAAEPPPRFFFMGSGSLHLKNLRNSREARVSLLNRDGSFNEAGFATVDQVFGYPSAGRNDHISPRLLFMLSYFVDRIGPGKTINIESAYRSPEYNDQIRKKGNNAARTSTHIDGLALDFWLEGVEGKYLWETIRARNCGGIGHYGDKTVHLDAGRPRFWQAATSGTRSTEPDDNRHLYLSTGFDRYNPGEPVRLMLSGISTYGFGVRPAARLVRSDESGETVSRTLINGPAGTDCLQIGDRESARVALATTLPSNLAPGRYRLTVEFCQRPFTRMPTEISSNEIELPL